MHVHVTLSLSANKTGSQCVTKHEMSNIGAGAIGGCLGSTVTIVWWLVALVVGGLIPNLTTVLGCDWVHYLSEWFRCDSDHMFSELLCVVSHLIPLRVLGILVD